MKHSKRKQLSMDGKAILPPPEQHTRKYCPFLKRRRNTNLKQQFCSLSSLEKISEIDELDNVISQQETKSDGSINSDRNGNFRMNTKQPFDKVTGKNNTRIALDTHKSGVIRLHEAAKMGDLGEIGALVKHNVFLDCLDSFGWTPLYNALEKRQMDSADLLLNIGANPNFKHENGKTILHKMASVGNYSALEMLLDNDVDVNVTDDDGWPALHEAMRRRHFKCAALLMSSGTDIAVYTAKRVEEFQRVLDSADMYKTHYDGCFCPWSEIQQ